MKKRDLWVFTIMVILVGLISSCEVGSSDLGEDLLPTDDEVSLLYDTIFEILAYPVTGKPLGTSETTFDPTRLMLVGNVVDTIVGSSKATLITQFNATSSYVIGPNMEIDTLLFAMHVVDYVGDMEQEITFSIHEFQERIYYGDTIYKSDYDAEGKYNPQPLAVKSILPGEETTVEFVIEDQDFIDKWLAVGADTNIFRSDSVFKDYFNGFYITAQTPSEEGVMARVQLNNSLSRVTLKYANDSTEIDSTAGRDFVYSHFTINEYASQKINIYEHDHSGTYLSTIIDRPISSSAYSYVQGMAGVNTRFSLASLAEWMAKAPLAINAASLVFDVVPEEESGIVLDNLPDRLMIGTILDDNSYEPIYDYLVMVNSQQGSQFGGYKKADSEGMFADTTHVYKFQIPLHFQYMVDGEKSNNDFILQVDNGLANPKVSKLWSNLPTNNRRIRLEVVYLKL